MSDAEARSSGGAAHRVPAHWVPGHLAALALLFVLPLGLRLWPIHHGLPRNYVPDTHVVRSALGMAQDRDLAPPVGRYSSYPNLLPYLLLPIYGAEYALGRVSGRWSGVAEFGNHVLEHPQDAHLPARLLIALFGALTPWVVFRAGRAAGLVRGAWVSAWLVATGLLHVHFSLQERPWVPLVFFVALAAWAAAVYARAPTTRNLVLGGLAAGLAFSVHQAGLPALGVPALAWLVGPLGWRGRGLRLRLVQGVACVAGFALVSLFVGHPYLLFHGPTPGAEVSGGIGGDVSIGGQGFVFGFRAASFARLSRTLFGYDPALVVLGLLGLWPALVRPGLRAATLFALVWAAVFMTNHNDHVRYLLPLAVLLTLPAGAAAELLLDLDPGRRPARNLGRLFVFVLLLLPLVQALRLGVLLRRPDTRLAGEQFLSELARVRPDARVALDRYGPAVALDQASLERLAGRRALSAREAHRLELLRAGVTPVDGPGIDADALADLLLYDRRAGTLTATSASAGAAPGALLASLGSTHLVRVVDGPVQSIDLVAALAPEAILVATIPPGSRLTGLPLEMDFPLTSLWLVERPGPLLEVYALP